MNSSLSVFKICSACGVEHEPYAEACEICCDERQFVPRVGQTWTTLADMRSRGVRTEVRAVETNLFAISTAPAIAIGHRAFLLVTPNGNVLWDPIGFVDDEALERIAQLGGINFIVPSHPHMFGVQIEWSRALGGVPILVASRDRNWLARTGPMIEFWDHDTEILAGLTLVRVGGHFPGSAVLHWATGAGGKGVMLGSDTISANPDGQSVSFMRSFPNRIPLSAKAVEIAVSSIERFRFERLYSNFETAVHHGADQAVRDSAKRYIDWISGQHDDLI